LKADIEKSKIQNPKSKVLKKLITAWLKRTAQQKKNRKEINRDGGDTGDTGDKKRKNRDFDNEFYPFHPLHPCNFFFSVLNA